MYWQAKYLTPFALSTRVGWSPAKSISLPPYCYDAPPIPVVFLGHFCACPRPLIGAPKDKHPGGDEGALATAAPEASGKPSQNAGAKRRGKRKVNVLAICTALEDVVDLFATTHDTVRGMRSPFTRLKLQFLSLIGT